MVDNQYYYVVESAKGGAGKTTFSLLLALLLAEKCKRAREENPDKPAGVCLLDIDILGTALQKLLFNDPDISDADELPLRINGYNYILNNRSDNPENDYAASDGRVMFLNGKIEKSVHDDSKRFLLKVSVRKLSAKDVRVEGNRVFTPPEQVFYLGMCSPYYQHKAKYRIIHSNPHAAAKTHYDIFAGGLYHLLKEKIKKETGNNVNRVIIDMPPGADGYPAGVMDALTRLKKEDDDKKKNERCINIIRFIVLTGDIGQTEATLEYINDLCDTNDSYSPFPPFDKLVVVINEIGAGLDRVLLDKRANTIFQKLVAKFKSLANKSIYNSNFHERLMFMAVRNLRDYLAVCYGEGIDDFHDGYWPDEMFSPSLKFYTVNNAFVPALEDIQADEFLKRLEQKDEK